MDLEPTSTDRDVKEHCVWIITAPLWGKCILNDAIYFQGETYPLLWDRCLKNEVDLPLAKPKYVI